RFDRALALGSPTAETLLDRALALGRLRRFEEAAASCNRALTMAPDNAEAHFLNADLLSQMGSLTEALDSLTHALALQPNMLPALGNRAAIAQMLGRFEAALADYDRILTLEPRNVEAWSERGNALCSLFRFDEALESVDRALALDSRHLKALHNRGIVLWNMDRFAEALDSYDRALVIAPDVPQIQTSRANALVGLLKLEEAMAAHNAIAARLPDFAQGRWNRAQCLLLLGKWKEGFAEFEWRKRQPESAWRFPQRARSEWRGKDDLSGKTLLLRAEQGFGDTLQFVRYGALAQAQGARVILAVQPGLKRLLQNGFDGADAVIGLDEPEPPHDFQAEMMSLALAFGTEVESVPANVPYIRAEESLSDAWREKLGGHGFKIGVSWQGSAYSGGRSFPLAALADIAKLPNIRLVSLQKGVGREQLHSLPPGMCVETLGPAYNAGDFAETAAVLSALDLVITCDTAMAHLAGALARPAWVALKHAGDWRWLTGRDDSPWYPTMRLFRQPAAGDWQSVFAAMARNLTGGFHAPAVLDPLSP
ncbi:MAG TPA: tetratricopeptide repeat-containing glycosyltransferase family protein, partial [Rhizomicrobium sp.]|nr:tetratricopeptide repeat-containing glycosyltransferase family protein [Rhizomicrobium sp.]